MPPQQPGMRGKTWLAGLIVISVTSGFVGLGLNILWPVVFSSSSGFSSFCEFSGTRFKNSCKDTFQTGWEWQCPRKTLRRLILNICNVWHRKDIAQVSSKQNQMRGEHHEHSQLTMFGLLLAPHLQLIGTRQTNNA